MSFSYSGNPADSPLDAARFLLGDTNKAEPIMQNEEIQYIIDTYGNSENTLKYHLFTRAATLFARDIKRSLGPQSEDPTSRLNFYKEQAAFYKNAMATSGLSSYGLSQMQTAYPKTFYKGMLSNPPYPVPRGKYYVR